MGEKSCANPRCTCSAEPGKEFCSSSCREARTGAPCHCAHTGCSGKFPRLCRLIRMPDIAERQQCGLCLR